MTAAVRARTVYVDQCWSAASPAVCRTARTARSMMEPSSTPLSLGMSGSVSLGDRLWAVYAAVVCIGLSGCLVEVGDLVRVVGLLQVGGLLSVGEHGPAPEGRGAALGKTEDADAVHGDMVSRSVGSCPRVGRVVAVHDPREGADGLAGRLLDYLATRACRDGELGSLRVENVAADVGVGMRPGLGRDCDWGP